MCISSLSVAFSSLRIRAVPCCLPGAIQYNATDHDSIGGGATQYGGGVESMRIRGDADATITSMN